LVLTRTALSRRGRRREEELIEAAGLAHEEVPGTGGDGSAPPPEPAVVGEKAETIELE
jgi:hypothetical protein